MWIDKISLQWNPWDTDKYQKKRWCHIRGMQKMNEYHAMKQKMDIEKIEKERLRGGGAKGVRRSSGSSPSAVSDFNKVNYIDQDMQRLATEGKGTTNAYSYS
jgi:hypothetical protein